ncbi:SurA N-terminal domain-containing protein [Candidatus Moduliflexota bacterium]
MMRNMRENPGLILGVIIFVVGAFVGSIFLVYGMQSTGGGSGPTQEDVIAVVEGEEIPFSEYRTTYNNQIDFYRRFYPSLGLSELEERFGLKQNALDTLVNSRLMLKEAEAMGLRVSDEELSRKIEGTSIFQEGGRFSADQYRQMLAASRVTPADYEESQRAELLLEKVRSIVTDAARVTEDETLRTFKQERDRVKLSLLSLPVENFFTWVSTTEDEVKAHYEANRESYRRPDRIQLAYITVGPASLKDSVEPTDDELRGYYDVNGDEFATEEQVRAKHILFKVPESASPEEEAALRERAEFVLAKAGEGVDFAELAREFSQDGSGPGGGDLGWFGRGQMVPPFEEAAFSLGAGEVSDVVRTDFGFHVIKVEETREAGMRPFEEVEGEVREKVVEEEGKRRAFELAEQINDELFDGDFLAVAEANDLEVRRAERLTRDDLLPGLGFRPDVSRAIFDLETGSVSDIYRQGGDYYIYFVEERTASFVPDFEEAEGEARDDLIAERAGAKALEEGTALLGRVRGGTSLEDAASSVKAEIRETALFGQSGLVPEAGVSGALFADAFSLPVGGFGGPLSAGENVLIYQVKELETPSDEDYAAERKELAKRLRTEKQNLLFESWLRRLRELRSVEIDESMADI